MGILNKLFNRHEEKSASLPFPVISDFPDSSTLFGDTSYYRLSREGYQMNYVIHKIIDDIAKLASNIPLIVEGSADVETLMKMPYPGVGYKKFMRRMVSEKLLDGNAYAGIIKIGSRIKQLDQWRPDRVNVETGTVNGRCDTIIAYEHSCGGTKRVTPDDNGLFEVFHTKFYNPLDENRGLSPVKAAYQSLRQNNEIARIHTATLDNDGAVKGFIGMQKPTNDGFAPAPDGEQMKRIRQEMNEMLGKGNRGKWAVWNWMFDFVKLGQTGSEMNWNENKKLTAIEIAIALGYPPHLLGFPEGSTFNNVEAAENWLIINTVLPILEEILDDLIVMFMQHTGEEPVIKANKEEMLAIQKIIRDKRAAAREDKNSGIITLEEAREEGGYPEDIEGTLFVPTSQLPVGIDANDFTPTNSDNENQT